MNEPNWPILLAGLQALQSLIFYYYFKKWISVLWNFKDDKQKQSATPQRCQEHIWNVTLRQTVLFYSARCPTMINYMSAPMINSSLVQQREGNSAIMRAELTIRKSCQVLSFCLPHLLTPVTQIDTECKVGDHLLYHYFWNTTLTFNFTLGRFRSLKELKDMAGREKAQERSLFVGTEKRDF